MFFESCEARKEDDQELAKSDAKEEIPQRVSRRRSASEHDKIAEVLEAFEGAKVYF